MKSYFDSQMRVLQEDVSLFAKQYPEHARQLNIESIHDRDPNVERLLEGFAYLTGRIEQQLDHGFMGLSEALLENLSPGSLVSMPSKAIAQFNVMQSITQDNNFKITKAHVLTSKAVGNEKTHCKFSVEKEERVYPLTLDSMVQKALPNTHYEIKMELSVIETSIVFSMEQLKLYFDGEYEARLSWIYGLLEDLEGAYFSCRGKRYPISITHSYLNESDNSHKDIFGVDMLKDFFVFRDKFMFLELMDLPKIEFSKKEKIELAFILKAPLPFSYIKKSSVLLGCLPITNVSSYAAEPISYTGHEHAKPLNIDAKRKKSMCLQKVIEIKAKEDNEEVLTYLPFTHYHKAKKDNAVYYRVERQRSLLDLHCILLSGGNIDKTKILSVTVDACNGVYPRKYLTSKDLFIEDKESLSGMMGTNITKPTEYFPAIDKQKYYWRLVGMLSENYQNLSNLNQLLEVLHAHDLQNRYEDKINALLSTKIKSKQLFKKGVLYLLDFG